MSATSPTTPQASEQQNSAAAGPQARLFCGDCLTVAAGLEPGTFRLIYLDPPFLTGRERVGGDTSLRYHDAWENDLDDYLPWLRERIRALKNLLCENGSLILHLDYHAVHYAKVMLDEEFGRDRFMNEIIWHYTGGGRSRRRFSCKHDSLLWYAKGANPVFNLDAVRVPYKPTSGYAKGGIVSAAGKRYQPHPLGTPVDDVWDIPIVNPLAAERVGYPTQKPLVLLDRLIRALTHEGELVGDFMCGSGTTLVAAARLNRRWVGADRSPAAISCTQQRLQHDLGLVIPSISV